jgi:hypothetical protein
MCASRIATPEKSSAEDEGELPPAAPGAAAVRPGRAATAALLALNTLPFLLAAGVVVLLTVPSWPIGVRSAAAATLLWLVPPLLCRLVFALSPVPDGRHVFGSAAFWSWWISLKLQTLFLRLPLLEELLRLVPGLYSAWLRLWARASAGSPTGRPGSKSPTGRYSTSGTTSSSAARRGSAPTSCAAPPRTRPSN